MSGSHFYILILLLGSNQIDDNNVYNVGLAQTYQGILYKFFEIGIKYEPPACGRRSILKTQFLRIYTVFPDTSSPDLRYSSIVCNVLGWRFYVIIRLFLQNEILIQLYFQLWISVKSDGVKNFEPYPFEKLFHVLGIFLVS